MTRARRGGRAARLVVIGLVLGVATGARAISPETKARLDKGAQENVEELQRLLDEDTTNHRTACAMGQAPEEIAEKRAKFTTLHFPDASGMCVSILTARGKNGRLNELYRELLTRLGGDVASATQWPRAIGAAALGNIGTVAIGNGKAIGVKPALAFDAGFTVAYQEGSASQAQEAEAGQLQALAEACLGQRQEAGTCFSAGYLYGAAAFRGRTLLAR